MAKYAIIYLVQKTDNATKLAAKAQEIVSHVTAEDIFAPTDPPVQIDKKFWLTDEPGTELVVFVAVPPGVRQQLVDVLRAAHAHDEWEDKLLEWSYQDYREHTDKTEAEVAVLAEALARAWCDKTWTINQDTVFPPSIVGEFA